MSAPHPTKLQESLQAVLMLLRKPPPRIPPGYVPEWRAALCWVLRCRSLAMQGQDMFSKTTCPVQYTSAYLHIDEARQASCQRALMESRTHPGYFCICMKSQQCRRRGNSEARHQDKACIALQQRSLDQPKSSRLLLGKTSCFFDPQTP